MSRRRDVGRFLRALYTEVRVERVTFMAGSIAYHAFISLLPFLLVLLLLLSEFGDPETASRVVAAIGAYFSPNASGLLTEVVEGARRETSLSILGVLTLLWGALKIFRSLDEAFSSIYDLDQAKSVVDTFRDAIVALLAVSVGIAIAGAIGTVLRFGDGSVGSVLGTVVSTVGLAIVFLPLFYLFPDEDVTVREVVPGTLFAAVGWTVLEFLFRYYVAIASVGDRYGVIGTILLVVTWLYFSGFVLLVGAAINAVLAGRSADVAELAWGENPEARARAPFVEPLRRLAEEFDAGREVVLRVGDDEVALPPPDKHECTVSAPDRPDSLGGEQVEGRLVLHWVQGRAVEGDGEGES